MSNFPFRHFLASFLRSQCDANEGGEEGEEEDANFPPSVPLL